MNLENIIARVFNLTEENWLRHANPWSVWTRYSVLPLIVFTFWTRIWIGWWCVLPVAVSLAWMFLNPVLFPKPQSTNIGPLKRYLASRFGRIGANYSSLSVIEFYPIF